MKIIIRWRPFALFGLALLGLALRLYGLNWDSGNNFHPDERTVLHFATLVAWPNSFAQFQDPVNSPLNPHFFAYGSFPIYLLALVGHILLHFFPSWGTFANFTFLTIVGRVLSALFDTGTILLTACLALWLVEDSVPGRPHAWNVALLAAALVTFTPFELQQAHFLTVDSMLLFFITLTLLACVALVDTAAPLRWSLLAGLGYGLALATKFSAAPLAIPLLIALLMRWFRRDHFTTLISLVMTLNVAVMTFLITMPYALLDWTNFTQQVTYQADMSRGLIDVPFVRQFAGTIPYLYEAQNMLLWGFGLALGLAVFAGLLWLLWRVWKRNPGSWLVVLSWVVVYGAITGSFYTKFMRYMLPLYPFLILMASAALIAFTRHMRTTEYRYKRIVAALPKAAIALVLAGTMFQGLALLNVYSQPNTRVQASRWIYSHIKPGSVLTYEQWDDALPVPVDNHDPSIYQQASYRGADGQLQEGLDLYGDDTIVKAQWLSNLLPRVDAMTMATDRLDKSIPRLPLRYPLTIHYYQLLFSGQLGFRLAAQFENHPNLLGITLDDSGADESYSVFDHPTVRIFVRENPYPYTPSQLFQKLLQGVRLPAPAVQSSGPVSSSLLASPPTADGEHFPPISSQLPPSLAFLCPLVLSVRKRCRL